MTISCTQRQFGFGFNGVYVCGNCFHNKLRLHR